MKFKSKTGRFEVWISDSDENNVLIKLPKHPKPKAPTGITESQEIVSKYIDLGTDVEIIVDKDKDGNPVAVEIVTYDA